MNRTRTIKSTNCQVLGTHSDGHRFRHKMFKWNSNRHKRYGPLIVWGMQHTQMIWKAWCPLTLRVSKMMENPKSPIHKKRKERINSPPQIFNPLGEENLLSFTHYVEIRSEDLWKIVHRNFTKHGRNRNVQRIHSLLHGNPKQGKQLVTDIPIYDRDTKRKTDYKTMIKQTFIPLRVLATSSSNYASHLHTLLRLFLSHSAALCIEAIQHFIMFCSFTKFSLALHIYR